MSNKLSELNANSQVQASDLMYLVQENEDNELEGRKILAKNAIGYVIPYATWQTMTPQEQAAAGKVFVPDFPTATPNATEIPMSSSDNTSVADMFVNNGILLTKESNIDTFEYACRKVGKVVSLSVVFTFSSTPTSNQTIASNLPAPIQQLQLFVCCVAGTNVNKVSRVRISNTGLLTDWYSSTNFFKTGDTYLISAMYLSAN